MCIRDRVCRAFKKKVLEAVDSTSIFQILDHLKDTDRTVLSIEKLNRFMQNTGRNQFSYDVFKAAYDADPKIQKIVKNFDQEKIELKTSEVDDVEDLPGNPGRPGDAVSKMAKNATDLG